jgi:hypothetical protein
MVVKAGLGVVQTLGSLHRLGGTVVKDTLTAAVMRYVLKGEYEQGERNLNLNARLTRLPGSWYSEKEVGITNTCRYCGLK